MFNIINFAESKTKNGCNLKLSQFIPEEDGNGGGCWESVYIYIPYQKNAHPDAKNPVICKKDNEGNLFIFVPKERRYVPKEVQKPRQQMEEKPPKKEEKDDFCECPF